MLSQEPNHYLKVNNIDDKAKGYEVDSFNVSSVYNAYTAYSIKYTYIYLYLRTHILFTR